MPEFLVKGRGAKSNRPRKATYRAADAEVARRKAEAAGTIVESVERLPGPVASPELIAEAEGLGAGLPDVPERLEAVFTIVVQAIHERLALEIHMGTAWDGEMGEVPWRARIRPLAIQNSPKGWRVRCEVQPLGEYLVTSESQQEGIKLLLLDDIEMVRVVR